MNVERLNPLVQAGSHNMGASYEGVLDALRLQFFGAENFVKTPVSDGGNESYRAAYHGNLKYLLDKLKADSSDPQSLAQLAGKLTLSPMSSFASIESHAKTDFGAFLALHTLSPLVISTTDATALAALKAVHSSLAVDWQADMNARLYGDSDYPYSFTEQWYADRAAMLSVQVERNAGRREVRELPDGWTVVTKDRSLSAQWEHMVAVTPEGYEVLTQWPGGTGSYASV